MKPLRLLLTPERARSIRERAKLTQGQWARALGCSRRTVIRYETEGVPSPAPASPRRPGRGELRAERFRFYLVTEERITGGLPL